MPADATIGLLTRDELAAYKALRDETLERFPEAFTSDAAAERDRPAEAYASRLGERLTPGATVTLVARAGGTLVGAISCEREARAKASHIGHVIGMMVDPRQHGRGIGRALLAACIEQARVVGGVEMLILSVTAGNAAATRLYEGFGFVKYGSLARAIRVGERYYAKDLMVLGL